MHRAVGVFLLAISQATVCLGSVAAQGDNVLLIMIDDLGPEYVGCYQRLASAPATPVLDQLAAGGVRFDNAIANPLCTPSRVCLQTGRHAFRSNTVVVTFPGDPGLDDREILLPEVLANSGYGRAMIGKWHLGDRHGTATPNVQGWPFFAGTMYGGLADFYNWTKITNGTTAPVTRYATTDQVDDALAWIQAQPQTQPWLLLLSLNAPHAVYHAPPANLHHQNLTGLSPVTTKIPFYKAMIEAVDTELGRLLQGIAPQRARTNILVFGDNGTPGEVAQNGQPVNRCKGSLYRTGEQIPFLANGPAVTAPGRVVRDEIHILDVFPTVLELCGVDRTTALPPGYQLDGRSLMPLLRGGSRPIQAMYTENIGTGYGDGTVASGAGFRLIRFTDDWSVAAHEEFYQVSSDPAEANDLMRQPLSPALQNVYRLLSASLWDLKHNGFGVVYGQGCPGSYGTVRILAYQPPNIGTVMGLKVQTPAQAPGPMPAFVAAGFSSDLSPTYGQLPRDMGPIGMPGCAMLSDPAFTAYWGPTDQFFFLRLPNDPSLRGLVFYLQGWVADPLANPLGRVTTAGYRMLVGG